MYALSEFLIAFGGICGIAAWFLFHKALSGLIQHLQGSHNQIWVSLGRPKVDSPAYSAILNSKLRQYILEKEYMTSADLFVKNIGGLLRQRLLFSLFCFICLMAGIIFLLIMTAIK